MCCTTTALFVADTCGRCSGVALPAFEHALVGEGMVAAAVAHRRPLVGTIAVFHTGAVGVGSTTANTRNTSVIESGGPIFAAHTGDRIGA